MKLSVEKSFGFEFGFEGRKERRSEGGSFMQGSRAIGTEDVLSCVCDI